MKHLFVINPNASEVIGKLEAYVKSIETFFEGKSNVYDIHITRWSRDAVGFVARHVAEAGDTVRVHTFGGSGTLYEVANAVIGLPNAQIAAYPYGSSNDFLQYFKRSNMKCFKDIATQVESDVIDIDAITDGTNFGLANFLAGIEAEAYIDGSRFGESIHLTTDFWPMLFAAGKIMKQRMPGEDYSVFIDGEDVSKRYASIMVANTPCYQKKLNPAVDAHPNDGTIDVYTVSSCARRKLLKAIPVYTKGNYKQIPDVCSHYACKEVVISSREIMQTSFDGEKLLTKRVAISVIPKAFKFVLPKEIDISSLPTVYKG